MESFESRRSERDQLVGTLVSLLSQGKFDEAIRFAPGSRVTAKHLQEAVYQYGRHLVSLPLEAYELIDCIAVSGSSPIEWSVVVPLFTQEEGRSDLSLELSIVEHPRGNHTILINDLHVL